MAEWKWLTCDCLDQWYVVYFVDGDPRFKYLLRVFKHADIRRPKEKRTERNEERVFCSL